MTDVALELNAIDKSYERHSPVLNQLDLIVRCGDFISISGQSGAGKSTLLNIIGLLDTFDRGSYTLFGHQISRSSYKKSDHFRNSIIGFSFQFFYLIPNVSVRENMLYPFIVSNRKFCIREIGQKIDSILERLELLKYKNKNVNFLSGGEKQRVALARSIVYEPKILLADEPTGNLDHVNTVRVVKILDEYCKNGNSVILVSHSEEVVNRAWTKYKLSKGKLERYGN